MAESEVRRTSDPRVVRKIHSAIKKTCEQKQCPIMERIQRALAIDKVQITRSRIELQLKNAIKDGLIIESSGKSGKTTSISESKSSSFRVPTQENFYENYEDDGHDWYCWVCHREGEVYLCSRCPRVIHRKCAELTQEDLEGDFVCYCCNDLESTKQYGKKEIQELATMLSYTIDRMKSKCEELWKSPDEELHPTYRLFVYQDTSLNELEKRVAKKEFDSLAKFHYEIEWLFHNTVIYFGGENKLTELARMVVLDGQNELSQIDICSECYIRSNDRMKNWFSIPCIPEHRIVYAKLGTDPPWPAKVLRENEDGSSIDVRFFGNPYQRAWIPNRKQNIWDLDEKPQPKKRSKALSLAEEELKVYLRLLARSKSSAKSGKVTSSDSSEEEEIDDSDDQQPEKETKSSFTKVKTPAKKAATPSSASKSSSRGRKRTPAASKPQTESDEDEEEEELADESKSESESESDSDGEFQPPQKRNKKKDTKRKSRDDSQCKKQRGRKRGSGVKRKTTSPDGASSSSAKETKAERRFREMQEKKMMEFQKNKGSKNYNKNEQKVDINKNIGSEDGGDDSSEMQLAQQIKMTDDYKMIEKLQDRVRTMEKSLEQTKGEYEAAQADLESTRIDLATERQKCKRLQEQVEKDVAIGEEKMRAEMLSKKQEEIDLAIEEERKRNELEFQSRMNEAIMEERSKGENKFQETLEKERVNSENKAKMMWQRERDELQRTFDRYKTELEVKNSRGMEKLKLESDELMKRTLADNMRRIQADTERILAAAKKKSWCSNCTKEAFYHCCWNTNYCSTDCQRVHWVSHRYQCTREMMSTCRSCQQRQNFPGGFPSQVPPK